MPTRRALAAAMIPAVVVIGVFWRWLDFPLPIAASLGLVWGVASLIVTRSVYEDTEHEEAAWRAAAPDLADLDRR